MYANCAVSESRRLQTLSRAVIHERGTCRLFTAGQVVRLPQAVAKRKRRCSVSASLSVIVPTYNRRPVLEVCLDCLEKQEDPGSPYEILVIDDASADGTADWLRTAQQVEQRYPHVRLLQLERNSGPARARNHGVSVANGEVLVFVDSDVMVATGFLRAHWGAHAAAPQVPSIAVGPVLHVHTLDAHERRLRFHPLFDASRAFFCTSNASVSRALFRECGGFDEDFCLYGWEDLECGERLRHATQGRLRHVRLPWAADGALAFHYKPPFELNHMPRLVQIEEERGIMGYMFYQKMPTVSVRMMVQYTWFHRVLWFILTWGGFWNTRTIRPVLAMLLALRQPDLALFLFTIVLNRITCEAVFRTAAKYRGRHFSDWRREVQTSVAMHLTCDRAAG
ncbi:similar to glycosyl transferase [Cyanidioschyzon merolae strain 10D]|uniref:Similar to glycosyl transferase n=1 Tax=Cyanidioschyzon merolae (strain NIES-3377 / 10D) TaxID=280699 RepID=M1VGI4_CYAM1|nr:similar to glycosyl transferase [Cyanidioschyzon merolae strain 10D]BAM82272.1 similar to glycosyl transferase [Cyanidioschyzon merolae strain 10D]|eukprot:XP_005538308.1 similar to glycosyl transferase [Cyanidioschyzon merolae strain 10D]